MLGRHVGDTLFLKSLLIIFCYEITFIDNKGKKQGDKKDNPSKGDTIQEKGSNCAK